MYKNVNLFSAFLPPLFKESRVYLCVNPALRRPKHRGAAGDAAREMSKKKKNHKTLITLQQAINKWREQQKFPCQG